MCRHTIETLLAYWGRVDVLGEFNNFSIVLSEILRTGDGMPWP